ncbi:MAG: exodeoxyribonuclease III [bacterium]|nr:exodeoxyribonuclease III [bacterium]
MSKKEGFLIAAWNVNSVKARLPLIERWIDEENPDVILLQETKTVAESFPYEAFEDKGYSCAVVGQKTYNGVAILAKESIEDVTTTLPGDEDDIQARYIEAVIGGRLRVASAYIPNGHEVGHERYHYKLKWLERLRTHLQQVLSYDEPFVIGGDFNVAHKDEDVYNPTAWKDRILCSLPERQAFQSLLNLGLYDVVRLKNPANTPDGDSLFSWWNYRTRAWDSNSGLRIDYLLTNAQALDCLEHAYIDTSSRDWERPSDHTTVCCRLALNPQT